MSKKNLIPNNPVLDILGLDDAVVVSPAPTKRTEQPRPSETTRSERRETQTSVSERTSSDRPVERRRASAAEKEELKNYLHDFEVAREPKPETKSKRLNLLVKPSVYKEATKIASRYGISVNELINRLLENVVANNKK